MFEKNREVVKFFAGGKLCSVKLNARKNSKKKSEYDPDYLIGFRVEIASFNQSTGKQEYCLAGSLMKAEEIDAFIEACDIYGKKAYQLKVQNQPKMPAVKIFQKLGGYEVEGGAVSTEFSLATGGPEMNAEFFIKADEAPGSKDQKKGIFIRNKGAKQIRYISMSLSSDALISIAASMRSAKSILNMWSAFGRTDQNIFRLFPQLEKEIRGTAAPMQNRTAQAQPQMQQGQSQPPQAYVEPANGYVAMQQAQRQRAQNRGYGQGYYQ